MHDDYMGPGVMEKLNKVDAWREEDLARVKSVRTKEEVLAEAKLDINNFFYPLVPGDMRIDEFEALTVRIYEELERVWNSREAKEGD